MTAAATTTRTAGEETNMSEQRKRRITRRAAIGGLAVAPVLFSPALANRHPAPRSTSLQYLDRNMYRKDTDVRAIFELGRHRGNKMQMMAVGDRRFLFQAGDVIEVTDALKPVMFNRQGFAGGQLQLAYNDKLKKWILMTGAGVEGTFSTPKWPNG